MNLRKRLSHFWNETLGVDCPETNCPETKNIEQSNSPEYDELKASSSRVQAIEEKFSKPSTGPSTGKKGGKGSIVQNVSVDEKAAAEVAEAKKGNKEQAKEIEGK